MESFAEQNAYAFFTQDLLDRGQEKWSELEVHNAVALCEWEDSGHTKKFATTVWVVRYKTNAEKKVKELINLILEVNQLYNKDIELIAERFDYLHS